MSILDKRLKLITIKGVPAPIPTWGGSFPHQTTSRALDMNWVSYNSAQFWHYLHLEKKSDSRGWQLSPTRPPSPATSGTNPKARSLPIFLTNRLQAGVSHHLLLGSINLLEQLRKLKEMFYLLVVYFKKIYI